MLGNTYHVSWPFGYEDYNEPRLSANKFDSVFTEFRDKWRVGGRLFRELSRTIEWCKAGCLFFNSFNVYMHLTVKRGMVPINFVQSMKSNVDVAGRKEKLNKTDVRVYGLTLKCLTLPPRFNVSPWEIRLRLLVVIPFISMTYRRFCDYPPIHSYF